MKFSFILTLLLCLQVLKVTSASLRTHDFMNRTLLFTVIPSGEDARCLDGSFPGYYYSKGSSNSTLIYMIGMGICGQETEEGMLETCYQRSFTIAGSNKNRAPIMPSSMIQGEFLSTNPSFGQWNLVVIPACEGGAYIGNRTVMYNNTKLYFRGQGIMKTIFNNLIQKHSLSSSQQVVLSGGSAGALGTYQYSNYLHKILPNSLVRAVPDSGYFLDRTKSFHTILQTFGTFLKNKEYSDIFPECSYQYDEDSSEFYKCILPEYSWKFIIPDTFIVGSLYDKWQYHEVYNFTCSNNLKQCTQDQIYFMDYLKDIEYTQVSYIISQRPSWGAWLISCSFHGIIQSDRIYDLNFTIPDKSEWTVQKTLSSWLNYEDADTKRLDKVNWPHNTGCS